MVLKLDPEVAIAIANAQANAQGPRQIAVGQISARRKLHDSALALTNPSVPEQVSVDEFVVDGDDGNRIRCRWYSVTNQHPSNPPTAAILYLHGGGFILGNVPLFDGVCGSYVLNTGVPFLSVEYRLAPEHPYPKALEDANAALFWLHANAILLNVDTDRISVMGDSAGGGLAAALTHYCVHNNGPKIAKQILIYPMLDDRTPTIAINPEILPYLTWTAADNITGWTALLGPSTHRSVDLPPWAAPARMSNSDARKLPNLFMDIAELDMFAVENADYAARVIKAGISVEAHFRAGCPHGWEHLAPKAAITKRAMQDRWAFIRKL